MADKVRVVEYNNGSEEPQTVTIGDDVHTPPPHGTVRVPAAVGTRVTVAELGLDGEVIDTGHTQLSIRWNPKHRTPADDETPAKRKK
jgi:hypothetical protein